MNPNFKKQHMCALVDIKRAMSFERTTDRKYIPITGMEVFYPLVKELFPSNVMPTDKELFEKLKSHLYSGSSGESVVMRIEDELHVSVRSEYVNLCINPNMRLLTVVQNIHEITEAEATAPFSARWFEPGDFLIIPAEPYYDIVMYSAAEQAFISFKEQFTHDDTEIDN